MERQHINHKGFVSRHSNERTQLSRLFWLLFSFTLIVSSSFVIFHDLLVGISVSALLTFLLNPSVRFLEGKGLSRSLGSAVIVLILMFIIGFALFFLVPLIYVEIGYLVNLFPKISLNMRENWIPSVRSFLHEKGWFTEEMMVEFFKADLDFSLVFDRVYQTLYAVVTNAPRFLSSFLNLILVPVLTYFMLKERPNIKNFVVKLIPVDLRKLIRGIVLRIFEVLREVIVGHLMIAMCMACIYVSIFSVLGVRAGWAIGLVAGACRVIPYVDLMVGVPLVLVSLVSENQEIAQYIKVGIGILIAQSFDGMIITPRILGVRIGLHPLFIILSVITLGSNWGFWGVLFAVPILAVLKTLGDELLPLYYQSPFYRGRFFGGPGYIRSRRKGDIFKDKPQKAPE